MCSSGQIAVKTLPTKLTQVWCFFGVMSPDVLFQITLSSKTFLTIILTFGPNLVKLSNLKIQHFEKISFEV